MRAVILAGGKGARLAPYTTVLPKPLMPVGDMPILELLIRQLSRADVDRVTLAVGHLATLLMAYFQDGSSLGVPIDYSLEAEPLGTAGPLSLVSGLDGTFLVMNGDLLTDLDFLRMVEAHRRSGALATIGVHRRTVKIDLGVIEMDGAGRLVHYVEKPTHDFVVSMGVYAMEPNVLEHIGDGEHIDLPGLVERLLDAGEPVNTFMHEGYWLDIGRPDDFQKAQDDVDSILARILG